MTWTQREVGAWIACTGCSVPLKSGPDQISNYFSMFPSPGKCPECSTTLDWWHAVTRAIEENFFFIQALEAAGATTTLVRKKMNKGEFLTIDFDQSGVPADATIVAVNMTPQGSMIPYQARQNFYVGEAIPHALTFRPAPIKNEEPPEEVALAIMVTWFKTTGGLEHEYLFEAASSFAAETRAHGSTKWERTVVPANLALELAIGRLVGDGLRKVGLSDDRLDYSKELNLVLPLLSRTFSVKPLPTHLLDEANRLRRFRNDMVHGGKPRAPISRAEAAKLLAAALFGVHYVAWFRRETNL